MERTYRALDGRLGRVRECRFTLRRDVRGLACDVAAQPISVEPALCVPQKGVHGPVTAADVDMWCKWYRQGKSVADISEMAGRNEKTVTAKLKKRGVLLTDDGTSRKSEALPRRAGRRRKMQQGGSGYPRASGALLRAGRMEVQHGKV